MCVRAYPRSLFSLSRFSWKAGLFNLGQQWQKQPGQSQSEPGSHPARQSVAAAEPQQLPGGTHYTGEISNHESFTPILPSPPFTYLCTQP